MIILQQMYIYWSILRVPGRCGPFLSPQNVTVHNQIVNLNHIKVLSLLVLL